MSINCKNCSHYRNNGICKTDTSCIDYSLYQEFDVLSIEIDGKRLEEELRKNLANNIVPGYYHKGNVDTIEFSLENNLSFVQGNIVKYVVRYKEKNGLEDLKKAMEYLKRLIEFEEGNK